MTTPAVSVTGLTKVFGRKEKRSVALESLDLAVEPGKIFGLLGPNGAGKTTLVKILLGLVRKTSGEAHLLGRPAGNAEVRRKVGYLPEAHRLPIHLSGRQMLRLFGMQYGRDRRWTDAHAGELLERLDMAKAADRKIREYSKGMNQRIGLAQALLFEPELVFLDEPTDGVDPVGRKAIRTLVKEAAARGTTVFINSHLLNEVEMLCDDIVILKDGAVLERGTLDELTPSSEEVRVFLRRAPAAPLDLPPSLEHSVRNLQVAEEPALTRLTFDASDAELNAALDALRGAQHTIVEARRDRRSLEDVFIERVGGMA